MKLSLLPAPDLPPASSGHGSQTYGRAVLCRCDRPLISPPNLMQPHTHTHTHTFGFFPGVFSIERLLPRSTLHFRRLCSSQSWGVQWVCSPRAASLTACARWVRRAGKGQFRGRYSAMGSKLKWCERLVCYWCGWTAGLERGMGRAGGPGRAAEDIIMGKSGFLPVWQSRVGGARKPRWR